MRDVVHATIRPGEDFGFVAECQDLSVVTQGMALDEAVFNLHAACALALEDGGAEDFGFDPEPEIRIATLP